VLTVSVLEAAQRGLDEGTPVSEVAISLGIKPDTLAKAVNAGKLRKPAAKKKTLKT
jgi:transposase-like protein